VKDEWTNSAECEDKSKVEQYLALVETRVLKALSSDAVQQSCSTTLLLAFATVDALGKLTHPRAKAGVGERFQYFLDFMGTGYGERAEELWKLRNALVHNVINVESYLSSTDIEGWAHLQTLGGSGLIYVNTSLLSSDLKNAFGRVKDLLATDNSAAQRAAKRLKWIDNMPQAVRGEPIPTPPPQVQFVFASGTLSSRLLGRRRFLKSLDRRGRIGSANE